MASESSRKQRLADEYATLLTLTILLSFMQYLDHLDTWLVGQLTDAASHLAWY